MGNSDKEQGPGINDGHQRPDGEQRPTLKDNNKQ